MPLEIEQRMEIAQNFIKTIRKMSNSKKESEEYYSALSDAFSLYKSLRHDRDLIHFSAMMLGQQEKTYESALLVARMHQHVFPS